MFKSLNTPSFFSLENWLWKWQEYSRIKTINYWYVPILCFNFQGFQNVYLVCYFLEVKDFLFFVTGSIERFSKQEKCSGTKDWSSPWVHRLSQGTEGFKAHTWWSFRKRVIKVCPACSGIKVIGCCIFGLPSEALSSGRAIYP